MLSFVYGRSETGRGLAAWMRIGGKGVRGGTVSLLIGVLVVIILVIVILRLI